VVASLPRRGRQSGSGRVASLLGRGQMSAVGGNLLFGWKGEIYCLCLGYYMRCQYLSGRQKTHVFCLNRIPDVLLNNDITLKNTY
jgi:hypothetical protein